MKNKNENISICWCLTQKSKLLENDCRARQSLNKFLESGNLKFPKNYYFVFLVLVFVNRFLFSSEGQFI